MTTSGNGSGQRVWLSGHEMEGKGWNSIVKSAPSVKVICTVYMKNIVMYMYVHDSVHVTLCCVHVCHTHTFWYTMDVPLVQMYMYMYM